MKAKDKVLGLPKHIYPMGYYDPRMDTKGSRYRVMFSINNKKTTIGYTGSVRSAKTLKAFYLSMREAIEV